MYIFLIIYSFICLDMISLVYYSYIHPHVCILIHVYLKLPHFVFINIKKLLFVMQETTSLSLTLCQAGIPSFIN